MSGEKMTKLISDHYSKVSKIDPCDRKLKLPTIADRMDDLVIPKKVNHQ